MQGRISSLLDDKTVLARLGRHKPVVIYHDNGCTLGQIHFDMIVFDGWYHELGYAVSFNDV